MRVSERAQCQSAGPSSPKWYPTTTDVINSTCAFPSLTKSLLYVYQHLDMTFYHSNNMLFPGNNKTIFFLRQGNLLLIFYNFVTIWNILKSWAVAYILRWYFLTLCVCLFSQGMNKMIDSELLEYSVHAGVQTTLQVWSSHISYMHTRVSAYFTYLLPCIVFEK